ncbi:MAG TPA: peptidoglycan DD-metalloendopeptidase family protein [Candidatus Paceibacterota bacterium]|nr:peptidoglycan DD-metalloendopeptidase family protein [Candidatus Paceibacterota bacterium]
MVVSTLLPSVARASVLGDFIATVTGAGTADAAPISNFDNVQTMALLTPAMNIDPSPATGNIPAIADDSALVPQDGPSGTVADLQKKTKNGAISVYVVKSGDTLSGIAALYGVTPGTILEANNLTPKSVIQPGDQLIILPIAGIQYTVKKGDTLESIANVTGTDAIEIGTYNGIDDSTLVIGSQIIIPDGEAGTSGESSSSIATVSTGGTKKPHQSSGTKSQPIVASTKILQGEFASGTLIPMANNPAEPARGVGPVGSADEIDYYSSPLMHFIQTQNIHGYNAVDLAAPSGTPIMAAASGEIIIAREGGWNGGYGSYVVINHDNGSQTLYAHMSKVAATVGEEVVQGQVIGYVGMTGSATGPHVHFEIRNGIRNPF